MPDATEDSNNSISSYRTDLRFIAKNILTKLNKDLKSITTFPQLRT